MNDQQRTAQLQLARRLRRAGVVACPGHIAGYIWDMTKPGRAPRAPGLRDLSESRQLAWLREAGDDGPGEEEGPDGGDSQVSQCAELAKRIGHVRDCLRLGHPLNAADAATLREAQDLLVRLAGGDDDADGADEMVESLRDPNYIPSRRKGRRPAGGRNGAAAAGSVPAGGQAQLDWLRG